MKTENNKIAEATLQILKNKLWNDLSIKEIKEKVRTKNFDKIIKSKKDILKIINQYFDYRLSKVSSNLDQSDKKDMIFEVFMLRFDLLQKYRKSIIDIFNSFKKKPKDLIFFLPDILDSILYMMKLAKISTNGFIGKIKLKGLLVVYILGFFAWTKDETSSLEKTMMTLDKYLENADNIFKNIK